jgi:hypothetical protein
MAEIASLEIYPLLVEVLVLVQATQVIHLVHQAVPVVVAEPSAQVPCWAAQVQQVKDLQGERTVDTVEIRTQLAVAAAQVL